MTGILNSLTVDPVNTIITLFALALFVAATRFLLPPLRRWMTRTLTDKNRNVLFNLVVQATQSLEQARRKGQLDAFISSLGFDLPFDLSDDEKCKAAVVAWVQQQVNRLPWGHLVDVGTILVNLEAAMRQDLHKGATTPLDELRAATADELLRILTREQIVLASERLKYLDDQAQARAPVTDSRKRRSAAN